jgi:hypothetical protein
MHIGLECVNYSSYFKSLLRSSCQECPLVLTGAEEAMANTELDTAAISPTTRVALFLSVASSSLAYEVSLQKFDTSAGVSFVQISPRPVRESSTLVSYTAISTTAPNPQHLLTPKLIPLPIPDAWTQLSDPIQPATFR